MMRKLLVHFINCMTKDQNMILTSYNNEYYCNQMKQYYTVNMF